MPLRRPRLKHHAGPPRGPGGSIAPAAPAPQPISRRQRIVFRIGLLLLPFLLAGAMELGLRLAGWGYPTSFFLAIQQAGQRVLVENPQFGWRFFPSSLARAPLPLSLTAAKPAGVCRIFVFGESAAMGDPEPAYGFARQLEQLLQARHPEKKVEVVNVAMTAINSHVIREIARDCAPLGADAWVIYAGNNEVVGPFGAGTVFGAQAPRALASTRRWPSDARGWANWPNGASGDRRHQSGWGWSYSSSTRCRRTTHAWRRCMRISPPISRTSSPREKRRAPRCWSQPRR